MIFYCPNCRKEYDIPAESQDITLSGRVAHKTTCPVCQLGLVEFISGEKTTPPPDEPDTQGE
jgi:hypothetical protein